MKRGVKEKSIIRTHSAELIAAFALLCALGIFAYWGFSRTSLSLKGAVAAAVCFLMYAAGFALAIPPAIRFFKGESTAPALVVGERSGKAKNRHPVVYVMLFTLLSRIILVIIAYIISNIAWGYTGSIFSRMESIWYKLDTDAANYIYIAENWYTQEIPGAYNIVFLPLFPLLIRGLNLVFNNSFVSAMLLNTALSCAASAVIYELALRDMGRRAAKTAVVFAFAMPAAFFYTAPMSEALFLLLSASALLAMRKGRFILAGVFCALSCLTRSVGIILFVPFVFEAVAQAVGQFRTKGRQEHAAFVAKAAFGGIVFLLGVLAYLVLNKLVFGDWFKFIDYQRDVWYQRPGFFMSTVAHHTDRFFETLGVDNSAALGLWLFNLIFMFGALAAFMASARMLRTSYSAFFAVYFGLVCGASSLVSAPRLLTALIVIPIALAQLCNLRDDGMDIVRARVKTAIVTALLLAGQVFYLVLFILKYEVY